MRISQLYKTSLWLLTLVFAAPGFGQAVSSSSSSRTCAGTTSSSSSAIPISTPLTCSVRAMNIWGNGYQIEVNVTNSGSTSIDKWRVELTYPPGHNSASVWSAVKIAEGSNSITYGNLDWNGRLAPNQSISFGATVNNPTGTPGLPTCKVIVDKVNTAPTGDFSVQLSNDTLRVQTTGASDAEGDKLQTTFNFGDGTQLIGADVWHSYKIPGTYTITQTISDGKLTKVTTREVSASAPGANRAPVAIFSYNSSGLSASLEARGSADQDGDSLTYAWDKGQGMGAASSLSYTSVSLPQGGGYISLTVFDGELGNTVQYPVNVSSCLASDPAPQLVINTSVDGLTLSVDARDSKIADSFSWDFGDGTTGTGMFASHRYAAPGTYTVTLRATAKMVSGSKTAVVRVGDAVNLPPVAVLNCVERHLIIDDFANNRAYNNYTTECSVEGSSSYDTVTYEIDWGDGGRSLYNGGKVYFHNYAKGGTYNITLTVRDLVSVSTKTIEWQARQSEYNRAPLAELSCSETSFLSGNPDGSPRTLYVTTCDHSASSDPDNHPIAVSIDWGDGAVNTGDASQQLSHIYDQAGSYLIRLSVTDGVATTEKTLQWQASSATPANNPPSACFDLSGSASAQVNAACTQDLDGDTLSYSWDFGDGSAGTGVTATHQYAASGSYVITLTVADGKTSTTTSKTFAYTKPAKATRCEFKITNSWSTGFTGWLRVHNQSTNQVSNWGAQLNFTGNAKVSSFWNGTVTGSNPYQVTSVGWNNTINPGGFAEVGFQVWGTNVPHALPQLSGISCE